ncbi:MAG: O-antigen ligase domain-containing protein, partial [Acidobacteria bacterium]
GWRRRGGLLATLLVAVALVTLLFTEQRGGWVAAAVQLTALAAFGFPWLVRHRQGIRLAAATGLVILIVAFGVVILRPGALLPVVERAITPASHLSGRTLVWANSLELATERPLLGWGLGSFSPVYDHKDQWWWPPPRPIWLTAHNLYLMLAFERGVLGLAVFGLLIWAGVTSIRRGLASDTGEERQFAVGLAMSFGGFLVYGLVQYLLFLKNIEFLFWILLGALAVTAPVELKPRRSLVRTAQIFCLLALVLVPWRLLTLHRPMFRGNQRYGYHVPEGRKPDVYHWIEDIAARRLPWEGETLVVWLANGHPRPGEHPVRVTIRLDGRVIAELDVLGRWQRHDFQIGPPQKEWLLLTFEADRTFRPFSENRKYPELGASTDIRRLGAAVRWVVWLDEEQEVGLEVATPQPAAFEDDETR